VVSRGIKPVCIFGSLLLLLSTLFLIFAVPSVMVLTGSWMLFSAGMSMTSTACIIAMIDYVPRSRTAEATGLMQSVQTIGGMIGPVITGIILASAKVSSPGSDIPAGSFVAVHHLLAAVVTIILFLSFLLGTCRSISSVDLQPCPDNNL
jgi:MFS family permease